MQPTLIIARNLRTIENYYRDSNFFSQDNSISRYSFINQNGEIKFVQFITRMEQLYGLSHVNQKILLLHGWKDIYPEVSIIMKHLKLFCVEGSETIGDHNYITEKEWDIFRGTKYSFVPKEKRIRNRFEIMEI